MLQQIGAASTADEYRDIYDYAELVTELDPKFERVYMVAGVACTYNLGRERWVNTLESAAILRKGLKHFPDSFHLNFLLAYNLMYYDRNYVAAGTLVARLSQQPGPNKAWLAALSTRLLAQGGATDVALDFATQMRDRATDPAEVEFYQHRIGQILSEQVLKAVDAAVLRFRSREHRLPSTTAELVAAHDLFEEPVDPLGGRIFIADDGRARTTSEWYRLELYEKAHKEAATRAQGPKDEFPGALTP